MKPLESFCMRAKIVFQKTQRLQITNYQTVRPLFDLVKSNYRKIESLDSINRLMKK